MRVRPCSTILFATGVMVSCAIGCGSKPKPADPSATPAASADETPKWEGAGTREEPKPAKAGGVNEAPQRRSDQYDKEGTEIVLKRAARQVKDNCGATKDDSGKATGPWGKVTIQVVLGHNGHSKGTTVPPPYAGKPVARCIEKAFSLLTFAPWGGSDTTVDWEVELVQPDTKDPKKP